MMDSTRSNSPARKIVIYLGLALMAVVLATSSPRYEPWAFVAMIAIPLMVGVFLAGGMILLRRGGSPPVRSSRDPFQDDNSADVINMARIRVAGIGGLGMIVVALTMAWVFPRIGQTLLLGVVGGVLVAGVVVVFRRFRGPLSSGSNGIGGRSVLLAADPDDEEPTPKAGDDGRRVSHLRQPVASTLSAR